MEPSTNIPPCFESSEEYSDSHPACPLGVWGRLIPWVCYIKNRLKQTASPLKKWSPSHGDPSTPTPYSVPSLAFLCSALSLPSLVFWHPFFIGSLLKNFQAWNDWRLCFWAHSLSLFLDPFNDDDTIMTRTLNVWFVNLKCTFSPYMRDSNCRCIWNIKGYTHTFVSLAVDYRFSLKETRLLGIAH